MHIQPILTDIADQRPVAIPLIVRCHVDGEVIVKYDPAVPGLAALIGDYQARFSAHPLSDRALTYIHDEATELLDALGYETDPYGRKKWVYAFICDLVADLSLSRVQSTTRQLTQGELAVKNRTTVDPAELLEYGLDAFVTVVENEIVSIASVNPGGDESCAEINIQTAPLYRGRGYGVSNVVALSEFLIKQGKEVIYEVSRYNHPSIATAKAAGFSEEARLYMLPCYHF